MPSDADRSELVDRDALPEDVPPVDDRPVQLLDETEDGFGAGGDIDFGETGDAMLGEIGPAEWAGDDTGPRLGQPSSGTPADRVPMSAEEAAVHVVGVDGGAP